MRFTEMANRGLAVPYGVIETYTGRVVEPLNMDPNEVCIEDIAAGLARRTRYPGHSSKPYTVAQHCVDLLVAVILELKPKPVSARMRLAILLHDAAEAFLPDIPRPIKGSFFVQSREVDDTLESFASVETRLRHTIVTGLGIRGDLPFDDIKDWDLRMLATEARDLMPSKGSWWADLQGVKPFPVAVYPLAMDLAQHNFEYAVRHAIAALGTHKP